MLRAVFLDIDNTLLDFDAFVRGTIAEGFPLFGLPPYEERMFRIFREINLGLWRELEQGKLNLEQLREVRSNRIFAALGLAGKRETAGLLRAKGFETSLHNDFNGKTRFVVGRRGSKSQNRC